MLPHATAMLQQPRVPSTGQRQAVEIYIKWQEVLRMKKTYLDILSRTTGHSLEKLDRVRPPRTRKPLLPRRVAHRPGWRL
jgi:ATP-dependent protease ClpP protease subunit